MHKANVDVEMTIDILHCSEVMPPDAVVLVSGDGDFVPPHQISQGRSIHVETASLP